jgi:hypothetical protein
VDAASCFGSADIFFFDFYRRFMVAQSAQFGSTTQMFKSTIGKLGVMLNTGGSNHMLYLVFFVIFVFLVLWYLMSRK